MTAMDFHRAQNLRQRLGRVLRGKQVTDGVGALEMVIVDLLMSMPRVEEEDVLAAFDAMAADVRNIVRERYAAQEAELMAPLPDQIRPRLGQLVRMLASDQDGEALAAARAIGRTLASGGVTFHDLAEVVEAGSAGVKKIHFVWDVWDSPEPTHKGPPSWNELRDFERRDWLTTFVRRLDIPDAAERAALLRFRAEYLSPVGMSRPTRQQIEMFTRLMARAWKVGVRP